ncbi:MAG: tRNA-queuosine alpha-mannosyltransferase domain-containing protein [Anaerolineae bacterium]
MRVCLLEPYDTGSHGAWLRGYAAYSRHQVTSLTLDGHYWKWRMHGGAVTLARRYLEQNLAMDILLASDMLDLSTFRSLTRHRTAELPAALYMHENQLTYPVRPGDHRDLHYGFINYVSMLSAEAVWFNSLYHLASWFAELPDLLKHFPDFNELPTVNLLKERSGVLPLGLDLKPFDAYKPNRAKSGPPLILWNHRWEYDKNPADFFKALYQLQEMGLQFRVAVLGEGFVQVPPEFNEARERLGERIVQFGYVDSREDYARWLWLSDIIVSTAHHEFFGSSVVEAMYCGCFPILPNRLAYPQYIPESKKSHCLYNSQDELVVRLAAALTDITALRADSFRPQAELYDWSIVAPQYDDALEHLAQTQEVRC